jgi:hypothetical protein
VRTFLERDLPQLGSQVPAALGERKSPIAGVDDVEPIEAQVWRDIKPLPA